MADARGRPPAAAHKQQQPARALSASAAHRVGSSQQPLAAWDGYLGVVATAKGSPAAPATSLTVGAGGHAEAGGGAGASPLFRYASGAGATAGPAPGSSLAVAFRRARPASAAAGFRGDTTRVGGGVSASGGAGAAAAVPVAAAAAAAAAHPAFMAAHARGGGGPVRAYAIPSGPCSPGAELARGSGRSSPPTRAVALYQHMHGSAGSVGQSSASNPNAPPTGAGVPQAGRGARQAAGAGAAAASSSAAAAAAASHGAVPIFVRAVGSSPGGSGGGGSMLPAAAAAPTRPQSAGPVRAPPAAGGGAGDARGGAPDARPNLVFTPAGLVTAAVLDHSGRGRTSAVPQAHARAASAPRERPSAQAAAAAAAAAAAPAPATTTAAPAAAVGASGRAQSAAPRAPAYGAAGSAAVALRRRSSTASSSSGGSLDDNGAPLPSRAADARAQIEALKAVVSSARFNGRGSPDMYAVGKVLGEGSFGKVRLAMHKLTGVRVAIKTYEKAKLRDPAHWRRAMQEIRLMERLNHPFVIRMLECIDSPKRVHIVMEYAGGGNLCQYVKAHKRLLEEEARRIFIQILLAAEYMHNSGIIHRDIKLENVLFDDAKNMKLVDFGFSVGCRDPTKRLKIFCGTPSYMAPEIVMRQEYLGRPVDVWSLGVLLYAMLVGSFPFVAKSYPDLYKMIIRANLKIPEQLSKAARDLIRRMMHPDPSKRFTLSQARRHPWASGVAHAEMRSVLTLPEKCLTMSEDVAKDLYDVILGKMEELGFKREHVARSVLARARNAYTSAYYLLLLKLGRPRSDGGGAVPGAPSALLAAATGGGTGAAATAAVHRHHPSRAAVATAVAAPRALIGGGGGGGGGGGSDAEDDAVASTGGGGGLPDGSIRVDDGLDGGGGSDEPKARPAPAVPGDAWASRGRVDSNDPVAPWGPTSQASARSDSSSDSGRGRGGGGARVSVPMRPASAPISRARSSAAAGSAALASRGGVGSGGAPTAATGGSSGGAAAMTSAGPRRPSPFG